MPPKEAAYLARCKHSKKVRLVFREFYLALFHIVDVLHAVMGEFFMGHFGEFFSTRLICSVGQVIQNCFQLVRNILCEVFCLEIKKVDVFLAKKEKYIF